MSESKIVKLEDVNQKRFWIAIMTMIGLVAATLGVTLLLQLNEKTARQLDELSERVQRAPAPSASEPART